MDYWAETMQDDVYMIVSDGWKAVLDGKPNTDLIPQPLIVRRYFAAEQAAIEKLEADRTPSPARWKNWTRNTAARTVCSPRPRPTRASSPRPASRRGWKKIKGNDNGQRGG